MNEGLSAREFLKRWLRLPATNGKILVLSWALGLMLAAGVYVYFHGQAVDSDARRELQQSDRRITDALRRLEAIEQPSPADLRRRLARAIRSLTPEQARRILRRALEGLSPPERRRLLRFLEGGGRSGGGNPPPGPRRPPP